MTDEQFINEVKRILPNHELGKSLPYEEFKKHEHELFDLLSNEIESRFEAIKTEPYKSESEGKE